MAYKFSVNMIDTAIQFVFGSVLLPLVAQGVSASGSRDVFRANVASTIGETAAEPDISQRELNIADLLTTAAPTSSGVLPVGAWVGIAFAILAALVIGLFFFVGHRRVREYYVSMMQNRDKPSKSAPTASKPADVLTLDSLDVRCSTRSDNGRVSSGYDHCFSPRTCDIPFAPVEVETDGRLSPKLPILSKREGSAAGTPSSLRGV